MYEKLLPIGTVVILRGGIRKLMITGIKVANVDAPEKVYDYIGVLYPEGFMGDKSNFMFNHSEINDVVYKGYTNPERDEFINFLEEQEKAEKEEKEE